MLEAPSREQSRLSQGDKGTKSGAEGPHLQRHQHTHQDSKLAGVGDIGNVCGVGGGGGGEGAPRRCLLCHPKALPVQFQKKQKCSIIQRPQSKSYSKKNASLWDITS